MARSIKTIADEIEADWAKISPHAEPYLNAMHELDTVEDMYYQDSAPSVIRYFLSNATSWRGDKARTIKAELNKMIKDKY